MEAIKTTPERATQIATKNVKAFGTAAANADLNQLNIQRRKPMPQDVEIEILYCVIPMRRSFAGSMIGGIPETQEMLDFCGKRNIVSDIEMINIQQINEAYNRLLKGDVKYRFVIDMASLKK